MHPCVLAAVQDLGLQLNNFGEEKPRVRFVWMLGDESGLDTGEPLLLLQSMNLSLHRDSTLYKVLQSAMGSSPDPDMDLETLVGLQARIVVTHADSNGRTYANAAEILPAEKGQKVPIPDAWRPPQVRRRNSEQNSRPMITDDDIPF
jgi:hypothetical protein